MLCVSDSLGYFKRPFAKSVVLGISPRIPRLGEWARVTQTLLHPWSARGSGSHRELDTSPAPARFCSGSFTELGTQVTASQTVRRCPCLSPQPRACDLSQPRASICQEEEEGRSQAGFDIDTGARGVCSIGRLCPGKRFPRVPSHLSLVAACAFRWDPGAGRWEPRGPKEGGLTVPPCPWGHVTVLPVTVPGVRNMLELPRLVLEIRTSAHTGLGCCCVWSRLKQPIHSRQI